MRLFHYTVGMKIESILNDGFIQTSPLKPVYGETPLVWLSTNDNYEQTARKAALTATGEELLLTIKQMDEHTSGVYRFVFDIDSENCKELQHWQYIFKRCGISSKIRHRLINRANESGADPQEWWGHIKTPLSISEDVSLERMIIQEDGSFFWKDVDLYSLYIKKNNIISMTCNELASKGVTLDLDHLWKS